MAEEKKKNKSVKTEIELGQNDTIHDRNISDELKESFLEYAMSVIVSRAIPDSRDGLKPVQRRILYAMKTLGLTSTAKTRKSATIVGECFVKDTMVLTKTGLKPIQDIQIGDLVHTQTGIKPVTELYEMPSKPLLKISLQNGMSNTVTTSQKIKVLDKDWSFKWKEAKDLTPEDYVVMKPFYPEIRKPVKLEFKYKNQVKYLNEDLAYFLGIVLSEGSISNDYGSKHHPRIAMSNTDRNILEKIQKIISEEFGYNATITTRKAQYDTWKDCYTLRINNLEINTFFVKNFDLEHRKANTKNISNHFFVSPPAVILSLISGLMDGDGFIAQKRSHMVYVSVSKELVEQIQTLLFHLNIFSEKYSKDKTDIFHTIRGERKIKSNFASYTLEINGENAVKLAKQLTLHEVSKQKRAVQLSKKCTTKEIKKHSFDIIPYAGEKLFTELSKYHLGGGWYLGNDGKKFRNGIKYQDGTKIRYCVELLEKPLRLSQVLDWGIKSKLERINSPLLNFINTVINDGIYFFKIKNIENMEPEKTYDMQVAEDHEFIANGMISHNCLGHYHPHGDAAVYDAMVRMSQDFSLRMPLVKGQGNFGSIDGDGAAHMRYTEAKLMSLSDYFFEDIDKDTVNFVPNFDGNTKEPSVLPARFPQLIVNGTTGIAVSMATSIAPHNLTEVMDATLHLADHPDDNVDDLMQFIKGPDFPTGGIMYGLDDVKMGYATGKGRALVRGRAEIVEDGKKTQIVITEIPYMVNKSEMIKHIANLVEDKKIIGIRDLRDESDKDGMRVTIDLKSDANPQGILNQLYKYTELEKYFYMNQIALTDGGLQPRLMTLKDLLEDFIAHRKEVVLRRTQFLLKKYQDRLHILEGLATALDHIDEIIKIIKKSENREDALRNLCKTFKFSEIQANAILETKLQALAKLEEHKIEDEIKEKNGLIKECNLILKDEKRLLEVVKTELKEVRDKFVEPRRTEVKNHLPKEVSSIDLIPEENVLITLSKSGYIKRMNSDSLRTQQRGGKGVIAFEGQNPEDFLAKIISANTKDYLLFFTNKGKVYQALAYDINESSRGAKGKALQNFISIDAGETITAVLSYNPIKTGTNKFLVMATKNGIIKKTKIEEFANIRKTGLLAINLDKEDTLMWASFSSGDDSILLATSLGQSICMSEKDVRPMGRATAGVCGMKLAKNDFVIGLSVIPSKIDKNVSTLLTVSKFGYGKRTPIKEYRIQKRGGTGIKTFKVTDKTKDLIASRLIVEQLVLVTISKKGLILKTELTDVSIQGRTTQGVRLMNLNAGDEISEIELL